MLYKSKGYKQKNMRFCAFFVERAYADGDKLLLENWWYTVISSCNTCNVLEIYRQVHCNAYDELDYGQYIWSKRRDYKGNRVQIKWESIRLFIECMPCKILGRRLKRIRIMQIKKIKEIECQITKSTI